ncbi:MAG: hypothetical protein OSJ72_10055 [Lachnospiraceae bacterium]|nr:hypothetical protein [Lachnospiraceae bacterium]
MLFNEFGNFNSAEEINQKAAELLAAGDAKAIRRLAEENGIDKEDAEAYVDGDEEMLCTDLMAALGKLDVEAKELEIGGVLSDWTNYIRDLCMDEKVMVSAVRRKDKSLAECMARLIRFSFENKVQVSDQIVDITKVTHNGKEEKMRKPFYLGGMTRTDAKRIIREYYLGR